MQNEVLSLAVVKARVACGYLGEGGISVVEQTRVHVVLVVNEESGANKVSHLLPQVRSYFQQFEGC